MTTLLAFDTATERMSIALSHEGSVRSLEDEGGAKASSALIPGILSVLAQAGVELKDVDAIAFGRGPGAFTGLRTACSVAQGLAFGAGKPVLPIDTLLVVAEHARRDAESFDVWVVMDARMNEIYAARYRFEGGRWSTVQSPILASVQDMNDRFQDQPADAAAGSALGAFGDALVTGSAARLPDASPNAVAMLSLADTLWRQGGAVDAALAMPLYVRDKVAQTTIEREAIRVAKEAMNAAERAL
jgi:tRNA threonylcarbamoyladenosine biosynthesis protein TsaB